MIGIIQKIEDGKAYIQTDDGKLIIIPIADVDYVNPHAGDQVFLIRQEDHWKIIKRSSNVKRRSKRIPILTCIVGAAVVFVIILLVCNKTNKDIHSKASDISSVLSIADTNSADSIESSTKSASLGENILVKAKQGKLEVTLDSVHWSGWDGSDWSDKVPAGEDILLVEMTIKDDGWNDEDNPNTFTYADSGFSVLDEEGATLSESEYYDDDGLYQRDPDMKKGQTVRAFVPLFAKKSTKKVTVIFTDKTRIEADVKGANATKSIESTAGAQSSTEISQEKEENTANIEIYSSFNVKNYVQQHLLSSKSNNFKISTNADGYNEKTGELDTSVSGAKIFTISFEGGKDITLRVNISNTVNITPENPNPIMYQDDKLKITASHFTTDNTGLDMYHFFFNVTNNTGNDIKLFVTSFSIDDKSYDSIWGSMPNHQGKSVADLGAGSPSKVHQWGLDNFDKIKFTLQIDGYTGHDMLTVNGTVSHDMFQ